MDLNQITKDIEQILLTEQASRITSRADIGTSELRRKELEALLNALYEPYHRLSGRVRDLPELPQEKYMDWAEAVLNMSNAVILVLDTTSLNESADIIRIYAMSVQGDPMLDMIIKPVREQTPNTLYTGISQQELDIAPTLEEAWIQICYVLRGCFIVSFNLAFVLDRLANNIEHYGVERLPFIGNCLMKKAKDYFNIEYYGGLKLPDACLRIGHKIPSNPPLAADRALGCLELLRAMANGVTSAPRIDANTDLDELANVEDHPF